MNLWRLVTREIRYQKLNLSLGLLSVAAAAGVLVAVLTLLESHDRRTQQVLADKQARTEKEMAGLEDDYRQIMKKLGFNLLVLPTSQSLEEYYATGYVTEYMPEEYARKLAAAGLMTIQHILPSLEEGIAWPERGGRQVILAGTRGESVPAGQAVKEPILLPVRPGEVVVGYELAQSLGLGQGDPLRLMGRQFTVSEVHSELGTRDDITLWIDLETAQKMLDKPGRINAILALKCLCEGNQLSNIRRDVALILPGTQVIEVDSKIVTRAEARERARLAAQKALAAELDNRARMRAELEDFASWLSPVVILGATLWIGLLAYGNVRQRRGEIAVLRAIGVGRGRIMAIILAKSVLLGMTGAAAGYFAGLASGLLSGELDPTPATAAGLFSPALFLAVLFSATLLCLVAAWVPALVAGYQDPAEVLREE
ncbi:MAG: FtsX-like permease family protein [Candidatus Glassbacteria bacterium]